MPKPELIPECPPALSSKPLGATREYRIELLTPLFGGGVAAGQNDTTMPIRGTSIRGQLQFWWRATRGAAFADLKKLREEHRKVWGATDMVSPVAIEVVDVQTSEPVPCAQYRWDPQASRGRGGWRLDWNPPFAGRDNPLRYFLFPFQGTMPDNEPQATTDEPPASCILKGSFTLRLRFRAELASDVEAAVWAWVNFGGLGARTRRGCGALRCPTLLPPDERHLDTWLRQYAGKFPKPEPRRWSVFASRFLSRSEGGEAIAVWEWLAGLYRHFRQGEEFARNQGEKPNHPGRSRYPEPETIREVMGANRGQSGHQRMKQVPADAFPRAELGLPIVFHFQGRGEPADTTLEPVGEGRERMASPLILKPLALPNGRAIPIIVPLITPRLTEVELKVNNRRVRDFPERAVHDPRLATYPQSPLAGLSATGSALEAFLNYARRPTDADGPGFTEVTR